MRNIKKIEQNLEYLSHQPQIFKFNFGIFKIFIYPISKKGETFQIVKAIKCIAEESRIHP